jgi:ADP-ribose pyrophosphatase YjhB (NUDIX family)
MVIPAAAGTAHLRPLARTSSLVPSVNVIVVNDAGQILMICRTDYGNWAVPGGAIDLGGSVAQAAVRETAKSPGSSARSPASWESTPTPGT